MGDGTERLNRYYVDILWAGLSPFLPRDLR
jgi:hypothetical protein